MRVCTGRKLGTRWVYAGTVRALGEGADTDVIFLQTASETIAVVRVLPRCDSFPLRIKLESFCFSPSLREALQRSALLSIRFCAEGSRCL